MADIERTIIRMRNDPSIAYQKAVAAGKYNTPTGYAELVRDLQSQGTWEAPPANSPPGTPPVWKPTQQQADLIALCANDYQTKEDLRFRKAGAGLLATLGLVALLGSICIRSCTPIKGDETHIRIRQSEYEQANERHKRFYGRDAPWYKSEKSLEENLDDVAQQGSDERESGRNLLMIFGSLAASLGLGYLARRTIVNATPPAPAPAAPVPPAPAPAPAAAAVPPAPAPAPAAPVPVPPAPAPAPAAPVPVPPPTPVPAGMALPPNAVLVPKAGGGYVIVI